MKDVLITSIPTYEWPVFTILTKSHFLSHGVQFRLQYKEPPVNAVWWIKRCWQRAPHNNNNNNNTRTPWAKCSIQMLHSNRWAVGGHLQPNAPRRKQTTQSIRPWTTGWQNTVRFLSGICRSLFINTGPDPRTTDTCVKCACEDVFTEVNRAY